MEKPLIANARRVGPLKKFLSNQSLVFLIWAITFLGAILRFSFLSQPPLWGDEAKTFGRICGTFQQLIDALAGTDFSPLHYLLYWVIGQFFKLTPTVMRLPPAIAGTLMIPAMYWLSIKLVPRRVAVAVALFTACSAFMLNFSRDAKMYAECWLFIGLGTACLLDFLDTGRRFPWYLWIICGLLMVGFQAIAVLVLLIHVVIVLAHPRLDWKRGAAFAMGLILILWPLAVYAKYFNHYANRLEENNRLSSGTQWVEAYNRGRDGAALLRYTGSAFLYAWEWPRAIDEPQIAPRVLKYLKLAGMVIAALSVTGLFPLVKIARHLISKRIGSAPRIHWRTTFWLIAWMLLPAYGFYCASIKAKLAPWQILGLATTHYLLIIAAAVLIAAWFHFTSRSWTLRFRRLLHGLGIAATLFCVCWLIHRYTPIQRDSVWLPRYLAITWPAFAIAICALLMRLPTRPLRWCAISILIGVNLAQHAAKVFAGSEPPTDVMARDVLLAQPIEAATRLFNCIPASIMGEPGTGVLGTYPARYYLAIQSGKPITPKEIRTSTWESDFRIYNLLFPFTANLTIAQNVSGSPQLKRIIVWDRLQPGQPVESSALLSLLPPDWHQISQTLYPARDHWTWRNLFTVRRTVYERP